MSARQKERSFVKLLTLRRVEVEFARLSKEDFSEWLSIQIARLEQRAWVERYERMSTVSEDE